MTQDIAACAAAVAQVFSAVSVPTTLGTLPLRDVMLAAGGAESDWDLTARGDYGLAQPQCGGATSFGFLQVNTVHQAYLRAATGSTDPCAWASWLFDPLHCAEAGLAIYQAQGLEAWTTYNDGRWQGYLAAATQALAALSPSAVPGTPTAHLVQRPTFPWGPVGGGLILLATGFGVALAGGRRR